MAVCVCEASLKAEAFLPLLPPSSDDVGELYPISRIIWEVKEQKEYGSAVLQETYYQVQRRKE